MKLHLLKLNQRVNLNLKRQPFWVTLNIVGNLTNQNRIIILSQLTFEYETRVVKIIPVNNQDDEVLLLENILHFGCTGYHKYVKFLYNGCTCSLTIDHFTFASLLFIQTLNKISQADNISPSKVFCLISLWFVLSTFAKQYVILSENREKPTQYRK